MSNNLVVKSKGPWFHRFLIGLFAVIAAILVYWFIGFVLEDIDELPITPLQEVQNRFVLQSQVKEGEELQKQIDTVSQKIREQQQQLNLIQNNLSNFQKNMSQLLEIQKLSLQKGAAVSEAEQKTSTELFQANREAFLANQKKDQELNSAITRLKEEELSFQKKKRAIEELLQKQRNQADQEYRFIQRRHEFKVAALKVLVLIPLLSVVLFVFIRKRTGIYALLVYVIGIPILLKFGLVLHEYFPKRYFKYILLLVGMGVVIRALIYLLRMIVAPKKQWLLKQYREAYERFLCPICAYPIRRGPFKYLFWNRRSIKKLKLPTQR